MLIILIVIPNLPNRDGKPLSAEVSEKLHLNFEGSMQVDVLTVPNETEQPDFTEFLMRQIPAKEFNGAIFYNVDMESYGITSLSSITTLCEKFAMANPGCVINYHYTSEARFPHGLELLTKTDAGKNINRQAGVTPESVALAMAISIGEAEVERVKQLHQSRIDMDELCSTSNP